MKKQVEIIILLLFGLAFLAYLFPFIFVEAAKVESGVTIKEAAPPTNETAPPTNEICNNGIDDDGNGATDEDCAAAPAGPTAPTCGLKIHFVPINYGQLNPGQLSPTKTIALENVGRGGVLVWIRASDWISDAAGNPTIYGPEITEVTLKNLNQNPPWTPLQSKDLELGFILSSHFMHVHFQLKVPATGFNGSLHQEITINCR